MMTRWLAALRDRRGSVAVWIAMVAPVITMAMAVGLEMTNWATVQVATQRAADAAALAGAMTYKSTPNAQTAATAAAQLAQLNGATGTATPTWNASTKTLSDNTITTQVTNGVKNSGNTAIKVTIQQTVPLALAQIFSSRSTLTVTGTSMAELVPVSAGGGGGQPCLLALSRSGSLAGSGSTYLNMSNCTVRSNNTVDVHGGGSLSTGGIYAGGAINIDAWIPTTGTRYANAGTIDDPYATYATLQTALTTAAGLTGGSSTVTCNGAWNQTCSPAVPTGSTCQGNQWPFICDLYPSDYALTISSGPSQITLHPGTYGALNFGGTTTVTFAPGTYKINGGLTTSGSVSINFGAGLYLIRGGVSLSGTTTLSGSNLSLVMTGPFVENSAVMTLSPPNNAAAASGGGVPGVVLAGNSTSTTQISGGTNSFALQGVIYFPNAMFDASGSSGLGVSGNACLEIIAGSIKLTGSSYFNSSCASYDTKSFGSLPSTTTYVASVVQ